MLDPFLDMLYTTFMTKKVYINLLKSIESVESKSPHSYAKLHGGSPVQFQMNGLQKGWVAFRIPSKKEPSRTLALFYHHIKSNTSQWNAPIYQNNIK